MAKGGSAPITPDYSQYVSAMTGIGNTLTGYGNDLYSWATAQGKNLSDIASTVSHRAGQTADSAIQTGQGLVSNWINTYGPLYKAQAQRATDFMRDLPNTMNQWAGKYGADAGMAIDASTAALKRKLIGQGLAAPSVGTAAIDAATSNQRSLAVTAASEVGRMAAMQYGDTLTGQTLAAGTALPQVGQGQENVSLAAGNQQLNAPESAVSTTAGAYAPSQGYFNSAFPYMSSWGNTMAQQYNQNLAAFNANNQSSSGWGALAGTVLGAGATLGAAYLGGPAMLPVAGAIGAMGMSGWGNNYGAATGSGTGRTYAEGGAIDTGVRAGAMVPPGASPSGGHQTDDVVVPIQGGPPGTPETGAINVGEFIWPKDVVAWKGEQWMQKEIMKARKEMKTQTVAAPEKAPASAIQTQRPMMGAAA